MTWLLPADVQAWLRLPAVDADLTAVCAAVEPYVQRCRPDMWTAAETEGDPDVYLPDPEVYHGAKLYAARQYRRRNSPVGTETWADGGTTFVAKEDRDISRALRIDIYTLPGVG